MAVPATTTGAALAVNVKQSDKSMGQVFLLPPDREQTPETIGIVVKQIQDGKDAFDKSEFDKAIAKFQEAYGLSREIKFGDGEGMALTEMCRFYLAKGQLPRAKNLGENAVEVLAPSSDKKALGKARATLAQVYLLMDNSQMAMQQLQGAMQCFNNLGAADSEEAARVLVLGADFAMRTNKVKEALQLYEAASSFNGQAGKTHSQISLQIQVTNQLIARGYLSAAAEEAAKAVAVARNSKKADELKAALSCQANTQYCLWEFAAARKSFEEALNVKIPNQHPLQYAAMLEGYGNTLAATGDPEQAKGLLEKALSIVVAQGTASQRSQVLNSLGVITAQQGNYPQAVLLFKQASEASGLISAKHDRMTGTILQNIGSAQAKAGENRNAKENYINALRVADSKTFKDPLMQGRTLASLAEVMLNLKEYPDAENAARKGLAIAQAVNDDAAQWRLYTCLGKVQAASGAPATESLNSALSFFRSPQAGDFPNPAELTFPSRREEMGQQLVQLLVANGLVEQALLAAEQLKEETFINEWHRRGGEVRQADRDVYNDMVARRAHLHATELSSMPNLLAREWREWVIRFQHVAAENPSLAKLIAPVPVNLQDVLKTVANNHAVVVDYLVGQHQTTVFTIDSTRHLSALTLPVGREELQPQVSALLAASAKTDENARATEKRLLQALYNELLSPEVRKLLPENAEQTIVLVPDSLLYNVPFAALLSAQGKFFVEDHTITMAPSLTVLMEGPKQIKDFSVVVAADKTGEESECAQISSVFDPAQFATLPGKDAEMSNLEEQAKNSSMIHFTQSLPIAQYNALNAAFPLKDKTAGSKVTANTLFELNLPSELAVLSNSSINAKDKGNGVQVFSRGLHYAGVRNVLMSLWVAPDPQRTAEIVEFYRGRQKGLNQAQSLRKAQMLALSKDPSPRAWASFQLLGPGF